MTFFSPSRPHLLVVEADRVLREVVGTALAAAGYALTLAATPTEALTLLEQQTFDLIVSDRFARTNDDPSGSVARLRLCAQPTPVGLLTSRRLPTEVAQQQGFAWVLEKASSPDMQAWLKTHAIMDMSLLAAVRMTGGSGQLARSHRNVVMLVQSIREGLLALRQLGTPLTPFWHTPSMYAC